MPWKDLTVIEQRLEFVALASAEGAKVSELCRRFGISRTTAYKWLGRAVEAAAPEAGPAPPLALRLRDRSRRPIRSPAQTRGAVERAVLELRRAHPAWGGRKISHVLARDQALEIAPSTVTHVLHRHGLVGAAASAAATPWQRFEHERPNSLWQMDFKGHFAIDTGRCHALTVLDDHSRFNVVLAACGNEQRQGVQQHLERAFAVYGLPERINTDNGAPWGSSSGQHVLTTFGAWLVRLGIRLSHSTPMHPQTNGKDERFHRSLKAEVLHERFHDLPQVQSAFDDWRHVYNIQRPHEGIGMDTPSRRYSVSPRPLPSRLQEIEYGPDDIVRKVQQGGWISLRGHDIRTSTALVGQPVALRPRPGLDGVYDLFFCHHRLDEIDLRLATDASSATT